MNRRTEGPGGRTGVQQLRTQHKRTDKVDQKTHGRGQRTGDLHGRTEDSKLTKLDRRTDEQDMDTDGRTKRTEQSNGWTKGKTPEQQAGGRTHDGRTGLTDEGHQAN